MARENTWTVSEAKEKLSEVLRLSREQGPQRIGKRETFVVVPEKDWLAIQPKQKRLGDMWVEIFQGIDGSDGVDLDLPSRSDPDRPINLPD